MAATLLIETCRFPGCSRRPYPGLDSQGKPYTYCCRAHSILPQGTPPASPAEAGDSKAGEPKVSTDDMATAAGARGSRDAAAGSTSGGDTPVVPCALSGCSVLVHKPGLPGSVSGPATPVFCSRNHELASTGLSHLANESGAISTHLGKEFHRHWRHPPDVKPRPTVVGVFRVHASKALRRSFEAYQSSKAHVAVTTGGKTGNTHTRYHGTTASCELSPGNMDLCSSTTCPVCNIIRSGFDINYSKDVGRFGKALYFTDTSSKAVDYARVSPKGYKYVLMVSVVCGNIFEAESSWWNTVSAPPASFDSVIGLPGRTTGLNYDEIVVYRNDAAIPEAVMVLRD